MAMYKESKILTKSSRPMYNEWQIPSFLLCAVNERDQFFHSPLYRFHDADFIMKLYIKGKERFIYMGLERTIPSSSGSEIAHNNSSIDLHYKIGIKKTDGTEFKCWSEYWTFPCNGCTGSLWKCVSLFDIISEVKVIGSNGALTLFCSFTCERKPKISQLNLNPIGTFLYGDTCIHDTCWTEGLFEDLQSYKRESVTFPKNYEKLFFIHQDSDMTIKVEDYKFPAHKFILGARSPVFDKMFKHDMLEKRQSIVEIKDCTPEAFSEFLRYLYSGELEDFTRSNVFDLYLLSDKYDVRDLKFASMKFIRDDLCMDTFCDVLLLALRYSDSILLKKVIKYFVNDIKQIIVNDKWISFIKENPVEANELYIRTLASGKKQPNLPW